MIMMIIWIDYVGDGGDKYVDGSNNESYDGDDK